MALPSTAEVGLCVALPRSVTALCVLVMLYLTFCHEPHWYIHQPGTLDRGGAVCLPSSVSTSIIGKDVQIRKSYLIWPELRRFLQVQRIGTQG